MKKLLIFGIVGLLILGGAGGAGYYFYLKSQLPDTSIIVVDSAHIPVPPPAFTLKGKIFPVPGMTGVTTTLDLVSPTAHSDYPMGRFTSVDGKTPGSLVSLDEFVSPYANNRRALPFSVNMSGAGAVYYLTILEGEDMRYATSVPIGERIKVTAVTRAGDQITLSYLVHDRGQSIEEAPTVPTSAIVNIVTGAVIQAGRNPATEELVISKNFTGKYRWVKTIGSDRTIITPIVADRFTLAFDINRISLETDCNTGGATFIVGNGSSTTFTIAEIVTTKMFCSSTQEADYFAMFKNVANYTEAANGMLTLVFADKAGSMEFAPITAKLEFESALSTSTDSTTP